MLVEEKICWSQKLTLCQKQQRSVPDPFPKEERRSVFPLKNAVRSWADGVRRWSVMFVIFWYSAEGGWSLADWSPHGRVFFPRLFHHQGSKHANFEEEGGRRGNERGVWLFGPALFYNHFDQSTINDQWGFLSWKPLSNFHIMSGAYFKMSPLLQKWNSLDPDRVWSTCGAAGVEVHPSNSPLGPPCLILSCPQPQ